MAYNEIEQRGTPDFPFAYFHLDSTHPRYNMAAHWHSEIEIIRVIDGGMNMTLNNKPHTLKVGDVAFINRETVHQGTPCDCVYECVVFHGEFLYSEAFDCLSLVKNITDGEWTVNEYFPKDSGKSYAALCRIFEVVLSDLPSRKFSVIAAFYNFFACVLEEKQYACNFGSKEQSSDKNLIRLKKILTYLRENFDKPITLASLAKAVNRSPKYIGSFFKNMTGKTPMEYLNEYRIEKATRKLRTTDMSVTDIAFSCGFSDLSYFIKTFKRINGVSPGKYRDA